MDTYVFRRGDTWTAWMTGHEVMQAAPARVSRNMPLPEVSSADGDLPYVISGRNPNGAVAVATLHRVDAERGFYLPRARVTLRDIDWRHPVGIFGEYKSLVLRGSAIPDGARFYAQDLIGDVAVDITADLVIRTDRVEVSAELIERIGLSAADPGDLSAPGLVMVMRGAGD